MGRTFTLEEAKTLLPTLGALLRRAREAAVRANEFDVGMQELSQRIFITGGMHVDVAAVARRRGERDKAMKEAQASIEEIEEIGVRVGEMDGGRLEFPHALEGREVLLCWNLGEGEEIRQWREDEDGSPLRDVADGPFRRERDRLN